MSEDCNLSASVAREEFFQPKDLVWLDPCDEHRDEEIKQAAAGHPEPQKALIGNPSGFEEVVFQDVADAAQPAVVGVRADVDGKAAQHLAGVHVAQYELHR